MSRAAVAHATSQDGGVWFPWRAPRPRATVRLVCVPYAGGSAAVYRSWSDRFPDAEVCAAELPGHATRLRDPLVSEMAALVDRLARTLLELPELPLVLFGHSMGALVAFDLALRLGELGAAAPRLLVVSAALPPDHRAHRSAERVRTDAELIERLRKLGGTPEELLCNGELMGLTLPILRADYALIASRRRAPRSPLPCNLAAFSGTDDRSATPKEMLRWSSVSTGEFTSHEFPGGHFYIRREDPRLQSALRALLAMAS